MKSDTNNHSIIRTHFGELNFVRTRLLRAKQVCALIGISRSTLYNWINSKSPWFIPSFPKPIRLGNAAIGWLEDELIEYLRLATRAGRKS